MAVDEIHKERMKTIASFYNSLSGTFMSAGIVGPTIAYLLRPVASNAMMPEVSTRALVVVVLGCALGAILFQIAAYLQLGTIIRQDASADTAIATAPKEARMDNTLYGLALIPVIAGAVAIGLAMLTRRKYGHRAGR